MNSLNKKIKITQNAQILSVLLDAITKQQKQLINIQLQINNLKQKISPLNIKKTKIIGKTETFDHPIKPKKKLIIIVAFITGLILSVFMVFFIEFIKSLKEEDLQKK